MEKAGRRCLAVAAFASLHQFDFVTLGCVDEGEAAAVGFDRRSIGVFKAALAEVVAEFLQAVHFKRQVREVRLYVHRAAAGKVTELDEFRALGRFEKNEF